MTIDRYTHALLTVIAATLIYLCVVLTPGASVEAQTAKRPGDPTGPAEVVVIGWRVPEGARIPVQINASVPLQVNGEVRVTGTVQTAERRDNLLRVAVAGWEENGEPSRPGLFRPVRTRADDRAVGLPITGIAAR